MLFVFLILRQDYWDYFFLDHFPEESDPTQSAFSGIKGFIKLFNFVMLVSSRLKLISLITMFYFPILFAGGDWVFSVSSGN